MVKRYIGARNRKGGYPEVFIDEDGRRRELPGGNNDWVGPGSYVLATSIIANAVEMLPTPKQNINKLAELVAIDFAPVLWWLPRDLGGKRGNENNLSQAFKAIFWFPSDDDLKQRSEYSWYLDQEDVLQYFIFFFAIIGQRNESHGLSGESFSDVYATQCFAAFKRNRHGDPATELLSIESAIKNKIIDVRRCPTCLGTGKIRQCTKCNGKGQVGVRDSAGRFYVGLCPHCGGTGNNPAANSECPNCKGKGYDPH
jgi:hypothetical protein